MKKSCSSCLIICYLTVIDALRTFSIGKGEKREEYVLRPKSTNEEKKCGRGFRVGCAKQFIYINRRMWLSFFFSILFALMEWALKLMLSC